MNEYFDFYNKTSIKSYNLNETMRYQLSRLDSLDVFTRKHCEGVANLSCRLCEKLKLNSSFTVYCTMCAYLHDVGKMFIPHQILQKNSKLTPEEYEVMQSHVIRGYNICMEDELLKPYANGALYHHEALDGSGYPNRKTINDIPLEGQIIRVADEYDAIVNKRQYKSHIGISDTIKILIENAQPNPIKPNFEKNYDKDYIKLRKKYGKVNKRIVKALTLVVIEDIQHEIDSVKDYVEHLNSQIKRLEQVKIYKEKLDSSVSVKDKEKWSYNINSMLDNKTENLDNFEQILLEYKNAFQIRQDKINNLYNEINIIKRLKI